MTNAAKAVGVQDPNVSWVRPPQIVNDVSDFVNTPGGAQDCLEALSTLCAWLEKFGFSSDIAPRAGQTATLVNDTLSIPGFIGAAGSFKNSVSDYFNGEDKDASAVYTDTLLMGIHGPKSTHALEGWGVASFKRSAFAINTVFWLSLLVLDGSNLSSELKESKNLQKTVDCTTDPELKRIYQHKLQNSYLKALQSAVTAVAMAPIALVGILFASMTTGVLAFLYNPAVMLTLTSVWCVLNFYTHFNGLMIQREENNYLNGMGIRV